MWWRKSENTRIQREYRAEKDRKQQNNFKNKKGNRDRVGHRRKREWVAGEQGQSLEKK